MSQGLLGGLAYYLHQYMLLLQPRDVLLQGMQGPATGYGPLPAPLPFFSLINDVTDLHVESPVFTPQGPISSSLWKTETKVKSSPGTRKSSSHKLTGTELSCFSLAATTTFAHVIHMQILVTKCSPLGVTMAEHAAGMVGAQLHPCHQCC